MWIRGYTRKSRALDKNVTPDELFRNHKPHLLRIATDQGVDLQEEFIFMERGSSESVSEREIFSTLLAEIDRLPIKAGGVLVVFSQDRLSRGDMSEQMDILRRLRRAGVRVLSVTEGWIDLDKLHDRKYAELRSWLANLYIEEYKVKQGLAYDALRRRGEVRQGRVPYGYWWDKGEEDRRQRLKIDDRESHRNPKTGLTRWETLRCWCREIRTTSIPELARRYHEPETTVYSALLSPTICGYPVTRYTKKEDRDAPGPKFRRLPRDRWIWPEKPGDYPHACSREEYEVIRASLEGRRAGSVAFGQGKGICQDVLQIEGCGGVIVLGTRNDRAETPIYRQHAGPDRRSAKGARDVDRALVDAAASEAICALVRDPAFFAWMLNDYYEQRCQSSGTDRDEQIMALQQQIAQWEKELKKAERWALEAETTREEKRWREQVSELNKLITSKEEELVALRRARSPIPAMDAVVPMLVELAGQLDPSFWAEHWQTVWEGLTYPTRRLLVRACIQEIFVSYQPPSEPAKGAYRGPALRKVEQVIYSPFVEAARAEYAKYASSRRSTFDIFGVWQQLGLLVARSLTFQAAVGST